MVDKKGGAFRNGCVRWSVLKMLTTVEKVRMIKGIDVDKLELKKFDGWNMIQPPYEA